MIILHICGAYLSLAYAGQRKPVFVLGALTIITVGCSACYTFLSIMLINLYLLEKILSLKVLKSIIS